MSEIEIIPIFSGDKDGICAREFVSKINIASKLFNWDCNKKHAVALLRLQGEAWDFIEYCNIPVGEYDKFTSILIQRFDPCDSSYLLEFKFSHCIQLVGETPSNFLSRLTKLAFKIRQSYGHINQTFDSLYDQRIMNQFLHGLIDFYEMKRFVMLRNPTTSLEALNFVDIELQNVELLLLRQQQLSNFFTPTSAPSFHQNQTKLNHVNVNQTDVLCGDQNVSMKVDTLTGDTNLTASPRNTTPILQVNKVTEKDSNRQAVKINARQRKKRPDTSNDITPTVNEPIDHVPKKTEVHKNQDAAIQQGGSESLSRLLSTINIFLVIFVVMTLIQFFIGNGASVLTSMFQYATKTQDFGLVVLCGLYAAMRIAEKVLSCVCEKIPWKHKNEYYRELGGFFKTEYVTCK